MVKRISIVVYAVFGTVALLASVAALVKPSLAVPPQGDLTIALHLVREQGAEGLVVGLAALWCASHFEQRRPIHCALLAFALAFSAIHWMEYLHGRRSIASPLINSLPLVLLLAVTPWRRPARDG